MLIEFGRGHPSDVDPAKMRLSAALVLNVLFPIPVCQHEVNQTRQSTHSTPATSTYMRRSKECD